VAGSQDALAELYDRYAPLAYGVALRILGDPARAEDVVQEAFMKIWNSAASFDSRRGSLRTWLLTAVRNRSIDYLRGRAAHERRELELQPELAEVGARADPWRQVSLSLERSAVIEALGSIPPEQRQAVELAFFGGYSHREIADMTRVRSAPSGPDAVGTGKLSSYLQGRGLVDV
jgi:RNA polymerase sigma-70 factor (ECF subfamily)